MPRILFSLLIAVTLIGLAPTPARTQETSTLLINLTSDDVWTQQMAFQFGRNFMNLTGGDLVIFLNVRAVGVANTQVPQHTSALTGKTPQQLLADLIADGARAFLCVGCTQQAGLSLDDRIDGVVPSSPELHAILAAPNTKVMSY
jgi:sulfur relay (sulfurtransferase) complex TusBCD TusD component (DsrE family)